MPVADVLARPGHAPDRQFHRARSAQKHEQKPALIIMLIL
jgi:hypothetical protein